MYRSAARAITADVWPAHDVAPPPRPAAPERRHPSQGQDAEAMRACLTPAQRTTLEALEIFQWRLAFVRRPLFRAPIPVLFDRENTRYVVIEEDGTLNEHPTLQLRA